MINTRQLTRPSPSDANLITTGDPLGMLSESSYDRNRFSCYNNTSKQISNRTYDIFNHSISKGGYTSEPKQNRINYYTPSIPTKIKIYINNHIPFVNPLIYGQPTPVAFTDKPLQPSINPLSVK